MVGLATLIAACGGDDKKPRNQTTPDTDNQIEQSENPELSGGTESTLDSLEPNDSTPTPDEAVVITEPEITLTLIEMENDLSQRTGYQVGIHWILSREQKVQAYRNLNKVADDETIRDKGFQRIFITKVRTRLDHDTVYIKHDLPSQDILQLLSQDAPAEWIEINDMRTTLSEKTGYRVLFSSRLTSEERQAAFQNLDAIADKPEIKEKGFRKIFISINRTRLDMDTVNLKHDMTSDEMFQFLSQDAPAEWDEINKMETELSEKTGYEVFFLSSLSMDQKRAGYQSLRAIADNPEIHDKEFTTIMITHTKIRVEQDTFYMKPETASDQILEFLKKQK